VKLRISRLLAIATVLTVASLAPRSGSSASPPALQAPYRFCEASNCTDGATPYYSRLIKDGAGNLYGTTGAGGANDSGTVFKLTPNADKTQWTETVLYSFCAQNEGGLSCTDGMNPYWGLTMDGAGNLYGTTTHGGAHASVNGDGTVFKLTPNADKTQWTHTVLYNFGPGEDGSFPNSGLTMDAAGNLYGGTFRGGRSGGVFGLTSGTVFALTPNADKTEWTHTVLYSFCALNEGEELCIDGAVPNGNLIMDTAGNLYGTTIEGGAHMTPSGYLGGSGTVFKLTPNADKTQWTETVLYSFCAQPNCADGYIVLGGLIMDAPGSLYGTTSQGGSTGGGTVFALTPNAAKTVWTETVLYSFCAQSGCADGYDLAAGLIMDAAANLYGATVAGGPGQHGTYVYLGGTVFKLAPNADKTQWTHTVLYGFCAQSGCTDGFSPNADLMADGEGNLYGVTVNGGNGATSTTNGYGTVFEITGSGFVVPVSFAGTPGKSNCYGKSVSALAQQFKGLNAAAADLGYASVGALQNAILSFCEG
jgi:uncharacterized repeat protein (TIGR03803 family)